MNTSNLEVLNDKVREQFSRLTAIVFDFDGVFTDNTISVDQNGVESVLCWRSDGLGLARIRGIGIKVLILSTEKNSVVSVRAKKMATECIQGVDNKDVALKNWVLKNKLSLDQVAYVGNDINDIPAFQCVGLPVAVSDAYPEVFSYVKYRTRARGGYGAVREVCDLVYSCRKGLS